MSAKVRKKSVFFKRLIYCFNQNTTYFLKNSSISLWEFWKKKIFTIPPLDYPEKKASEEDFSKKFMSSFAPKIGLRQTGNVHLLTSPHGAPVILNLRGTSALHLNEAT